MSSNNNWRNSNILPDHQVLQETFEELLVYFKYQFPSDVNYIVFSVVGPILIAGLLIHGSISLFHEYIYKYFVPPTATELHCSALAALYHDKRVQKKEKEKYQQAEQLLLQSIEKDESYFPAYLSLASLYIYRMKFPDKALHILNKAKDMGPLTKIEPLILDAKALQVGGNEHMVQAGGSIIFLEHEYLTPPSTRYGWG